MGGDGGGGSGRRGYRRNIAATGQGRRAASLAFVRAKGGYTARLAARRIDSALSPLSGTLVFFFLFLAVFQDCRATSWRQIVFAAERNYKLNLSPNCNRMNTSYVTGTNGFRDPTPSIHPVKSESLEDGNIF